jgi:hypothetical protein
MDRRKKLLSAIAVAAITASLAHPAEASTPDAAVQEELYRQCLAPDLLDQDRATACSCFLSAFPDSQFAPAVLSQAIGLATRAGRSECGGADLRFTSSEEPAEIY